MTFLCQAALFILILVSSLPAVAGRDELHRAIIEANWNNAMASYQTTPLTESTPLLKSLAANNVVMAQWFLADALAASGQPKEAAKWLYAASLGTRMDAELCRTRAADTIEYRFIDAFSGRFNSIRSNDSYRRHGLTEALAFHRQRQDKSFYSEWVCQMVAIEAKKPPSRISVPQKRWTELREKVWTKYREQSGLNYARSPDLIKMYPAR